MLNVDLKQLTVAGWRLVFVACVLGAIASTPIGMWTLSEIPPSWLAGPLLFGACVFATAFAVPGIVVSLAAYWLAGCWLARLGIATTRDAVPDGQGDQPMSFGSPEPPFDD